MAYVLANTSRVAAVGLNEALSAECAADGISVSTIVAGAIATASAPAWMTARR